MPPSQAFGKRRMRVTKVERPGGSGVAYVYLSPDLADGRPRPSHGTVIYGASLVCHGAVPLLDDLFEVTIDVP